MKKFKITSFPKSKVRIRSTWEDALKVYKQVCQEMINEARFDEHDPFDILDEERQSLRSCKRVITRCVDGSEFIVELEEFEV